MSFDFLRPYSRNEQCWCASGKKHKVCHGSGPPSLPGQKVPEDDEEGIWLSPTCYMRRDALGVSSAFGGSGVPIFLPADDRPVPATLIIPDFGVRLARSLAVTPHPTASFVELGARRFELLDGLGLDSPETLRGQLDALSDQHIKEMVGDLMDLSTKILGAIAQRNSAKSAAPMLWTESHSAHTMIGQTMLWADHYLCEDRLLGYLVRAEEIDRDHLGDILQSEISNRRLIETGVLVPVPSAAALAIAAEEIQRATARDLSQDNLMNWLYQQLVIEGPTAKEVLFVGARDDERPTGFYTYQRIENLDAAGNFSGRLFQPYDREFDYSSWIATVQRQFAARMTQELNTDIAVAQLFGADYVSRSPFRARFAYRRTGKLHTAAIAASIDVPWLPHVDAAELAKLARNEEAVLHLRGVVGRAVRAARGPAEAQSALADAVEELTSDAMQRLTLRLASERRWKELTGGACAFGSLALAAISGPLGVAAGALSVAGWAASTYADHRSNRSDASFLFWQAQRRMG